MSGKWQSKLKLSGNGNELKPLLMGKHEQLSTKIVAVAALMNICVDTAGKAASVEDGAVPLLAEALEVGRYKVTLSNPG